MDTEKHEQDRKLRTHRRAEEDARRELCDEAQRSQAANYSDATEGEDVPRRDTERTSPSGWPSLRPDSPDLHRSGSPAAHARFGLFTRGETQALVTATLGTKEDAQRIELLDIAETSKRFMLHYNFPPFSVGEVGFMRGAGRREIGHGALAERASSAVIPEETEFPYTLRVVSDILESNGSSSMASVCGATLALMDAGVPIKAPVAGIAMGLVKEGDKYAILTDIAGAEDHYGDMDFKVAGTADGITALQMDIKVTEYQRRNHARGP